MLFGIFLGSAGAQVVGQGIGEVVARVCASFPPLELYVISVEGDRVILERDEGGKIRPGMELHLFREGKEFTHPVTGKALGRFEESLGNVRVLEVKESYAEGEIIRREQGAVIRRGDKGRITAARIRLAVFQVVNLSSQEVDEEGFTYQLINQLEETNRFEVVQLGELIAALDKLDITDYKQLGDEVAVKRLGRLLGVRGVVAAQVREIDHKLILEARLLSAYSGAPIAETSVVLAGVKAGRPLGFPLPPSEPVVGDVGSDLKPGREIFKSRRLDMGIVSLAVGDVTGDGRKEVVVTDGKRVVVFGLDDARLTELWSEAAGERRHLRVDIRDINRNGVAEIFVTNLVQGRLRSYVLEYREGTYGKIGEDLPYFLRVLELDDGRRLVGQRLGVSQAFQGDLIYLEWDGGGYAVGRKLGVPAGISIYGFAGGDIDNDGRAEVVQIDDYDRLRVYSPDGELQWKSAERYGGYELSFPHRSRNVFTVGTSYDIKPNRVKVKGRIFIRDIDGDGTREILIGKNIPVAGYLFSNISSYGQGMVVDLEWDGIGYGENWQTRKFDAYVADFSIVDVDADQREELVMALVVRRESGRLPSQKQSIIVFCQL
jgi:TolB-like protein